ncbi:MAG: hypothetical protein MPJ24_07975 [Pirellulaceae bacterium]|nr:hypothetical protein [Pirellulaceae bacterium]
MTDLKADYSLTVQEQKTQRVFGKLVERDSSLAELDRQRVAQPARLASVQGQTLQTTQTATSNPLWGPTPHSIQNLEIRPASRPLKWQSAGKKRASRGAIAQTTVESGVEGGKIVQLGEVVISKNEFSNIRLVSDAATKMPLQGPAQLNSVNQENQQRGTLAVPVLVADPFADPFGDKAGQEKRPNNAAAETSHSQKRERTSPALYRNEQDVTSLISSQSSDYYQERQDEKKVNLGSPVTTQEMADPNPLPDLQATPVQSHVDGYNGRDCGVENGNCQAAKELLKNKKISDIIVDLTPSLQPNATSPEALEAYRRERLAPLGARQWKDRSGNLLFTGTLTDFRNERVFVRTDSGQLQHILFQHLSDDDACYLTAWWGLPAECNLGDEKFEIRNWRTSTFTWKASALCHKPLYFEEIALERYGHTRGPFVQPVVSGAHFFANIALMPYNAGIHPPNECQYALGYYRPGDCAPWLIEPFPLSGRGALLEAGAVTGLGIILP